MLQLYKIANFVSNVQGSICCIHWWVVMLSIVAYLILDFCNIYFDPKPTEMG